ncbi:MAG: hypothetical protein VW397_04370 [Candidatus Margulisiibacteriota bacterium]
MKPNDISKDPLERLVLIAIKDEISNAKQALEQKESKWFSGRLIPQMDRLDRKLDSLKYTHREGGG